MKKKLIKRERINKILKSIYDYPLTIIEAPMGFGKTTAVKYFLAAEKNPSLWITFMNSADDMSFLWQVFADEIGKLDQDAGKKLKSLRLPVDVPQTTKVLSVINSIEYMEKTVFVMDDYHLISNNKVYELLSLVVNESIDNLHLVIITRDTTNINFTELYFKGMCNIISQQQLKFSDDEIQEYCLMMNKDVSKVDLGNISRYTDGWVSLIYMILIGLEKGIPIGMSKTIDELIEKTLFSDYDTKVQDFLLKLSIMDCFSEKQASFVTQEERAHEILKKLHRKNAFVSYDEMNKIYKIHNVLLDFLRMKQHFGEKERQVLYRRLGLWYLEGEAFTTAYYYLNKAGDVERILAHLNNPDNIRNELTTFEGSFEMFSSAPQELLDQYPLAVLQNIIVSILTGDENIIRGCEAQLDKLQQTYEQLENIEEAYRNRIIAEIMIVRKFTTFNHVEVSTAINDSILKLLNGEQSYIMRRENEFTFGAPHLLYIYFRDQGTFQTILQTVSNKFITYPKYANGCGTGCEYLALAEYELETGNWQAAELNSFKAIYKAKTKEQDSIIICANFCLIRLYILQGKVTEALEMLKQLEKDILEVNNPIYNTTIDMCKGYIYANLGHSEKIPYWLRIGNMTKADFFYQGIAFNYLVYGKAVMLSKNYIQLEMLSESFVEHFSMFSNQLGFLHNGIFEAVAKYHLYGLEPGIAAMQIALTKGQADDIIMPFVENAPHIMPMLKVIANSNLNSEYVKRVLEFSEQYMKSLNSAKLGKAKLSQREIEVLTLTAEGLKREEIAARLFMSQSTVKTHLQNIYQKLEASGKISAIKIAQLNGII